MVCGERGSGVPVGSALVRVTLKSFHSFSEAPGEQGRAFQPGNCMGRALLRAGTLSRIKDKGARKLP